ncbi:MAG: neuromedin U [Actinobacteria bacterium]|nr:neuromedin U [Actinomycetota bacterium]
MNRTVFCIKYGLIVGLLVSAPLLMAQENEAELAKKAQNPVGDLISLPLQNNTNFNLGPDKDRTQNVLNIQPVWPLNLNEKWNLITRTIAPVISQPDLTSESGSTTGLGDINFTAFLSPAQPGKLIWGAGPVILLPTATKDALGAKKWGIGPSVVLLTIKGNWLYGMLANNVWSIAGDSDREDINQFLLQYFINYNMPKGWYLVSAPIITANWQADSENRWIVPFGGGLGKIFKIGKQPMNANIQAFYNAKTPEFGPDWSTRFQLQFLFPK